MIKKLIYLIVITLFICCKADDVQPDCSAIDCVTPSITINLVDEITKENIIIQKRINQEDILIRDALGNPLEFVINETNGLLSVFKINTESSIEIQINSENTTNISFNTTVPNTDECCDTIEFTDVLVEGKSFEFEGNLITIYI